MFRSRVLVAATAFAVAVVVGGCSDPTATPTEPVVVGAVTVRATSTSGVSVTGAVPSDGLQATTLDVTVNGSGFDKGSAATFPLNGVVDPRVHVNSTRYIKSTQLVANVTIAPDAPSVKYDVAVTTASGKKGIGTELFTVDHPPADPAIAYGYRSGSGSNFTYGLGVMNADGTNQTQLLASTGYPHPSWSPDGHSLAFHLTQYDLYRVDVSVVNGVPQASTPVQLPIARRSFDIAWSPDPSNPQIAYTETHDTVGIPAGLYVAPATPVTPYPETLVYLGAPGSNMVWIAWNPQATSIALIQRAINVAVDSLFVVDVGTRAAKFVREFKRGVMAVSWSRTAPDRLALAYPLPDGTMQPAILDLTTNTLSNVPAGWAPKWSPDDSKLVYVSPTNSGSSPIYTVNLSTGVQTRLTTDGVEPEWRRNP